MKKLLSTMLLSSLFIPTLIFAETDGEVSQETEKPRPVLYMRSTSSPVQKIQDRREERPEPKNALRQNATTTRLKNASSTRELGFCAQIDKLLVNIGNGAQTSGEKRVENIEKREDKREVKRTEIDTRRDENETKRKSQLEELTKRAKTDEQRTAITAFTTAIDKALEIKKAAIDAVLLAHRNEVDALIATRKTAADKALTTLTSDINNAKTKAKTDCTNSVAGETVRTNLKDSIQKAQLTYRITMRSLPKEIPEAKIDTKKEELKTIEETFKKSVEQARNDLKAAFKVPASTATSTTN